MDRFLPSRRALAIYGLIAILAVVSLWTVALTIRAWTRGYASNDWRNLIAATQGDPFAVAGWRWSPVAAWLLVPLVALGQPLWAMLHAGAVLLLRRWWLIAIVFGTFPFWRDIMQGNVLTFVAVAGLLAVEGSRPATVIYFAMLVLMPRPLMVPVAIWLLWRERWARPWFAGIFALHAALALWSGRVGEWAARLLATAPAQFGHMQNWLPSVLIGAWWIPIGLALAAWFTWRGRLGLASIAATPYTLGYYWLMLVLEARRPANDQLPQGSSQEPASALPPG